MSDAETLYREAFVRLRNGNPIHVPKASPVSQNNVAKEAGRDPSALKKSRFPTLIREIQDWVDSHGPERQKKSGNSAVVASRNRNRRLKENIADLKLQRDEALALLVQADSKILELALENSRLEALLPKSNVSRFDERRRRPASKAETIKKP